MTGAYIADQEQANPWDANNWIMCRLYKSPYGKSIQVGVKKNSDARWSHKVYGYYRNAVFVLAVYGGNLEYWIWPSSSRTGDPYHGVLTGAPTLASGYVHLSHTYYSTYGSTYYERWSLFDDITIYKGTKIDFSLTEFNEAEIRKVIFMDSSDNTLYEWIPKSRSDSITLDLNSWYLRDYWLSNGCPLTFKVKLEGKVKRDVSVNVNVKIHLHVRVFASFTLVSYDPELLKGALRIEASIQDISASLYDVEAEAIGESDYVRLMPRLKLIGLE